jgi:hypothetical protein
MSDTNGHNLRGSGDGIGGATAPSLSGSRVAVVASGEVLARVLGQLHGMGAGCIALEDPYRAAADIGRRHDRYDAIVLALPCMYTEELPVIASLRKFAPRARIILAAAEQHVSMLAAAVRFGATAVLTAHGLEILASHPPSTPSAAQNAADKLSALAPATSAAISAATSPAVDHDPDSTRRPNTITREPTYRDVLPHDASDGQHDGPLPGQATAAGAQLMNPQLMNPRPMNPRPTGARDEDSADIHAAHVNAAHVNAAHVDADLEESVAAHPLLSAEELHALLHDEGGLR